MSLLSQSKNNEETISLILRRASINKFEQKEIQEITKALERVPIVQMRWSIV